MTSVQPDWSTVVGNLRGAAGKAFEHEFKMSRADNWPKRLHHYTDTAGALGILQEQHLFMTHAGFLNDQTELRYFRVVLQQALVDAEAAGGFLRELAAAIREKMRNRPLPEVYVTCFCEKRDLLSQWRGYGAGRVAYSLKFDMERLAGRCPGELLPVLYGRKRQLRLLAKVIRGMADISGQGWSGSVSSADLDQLAASAMDVLNDWSVAFKHSGFKEEREWRLVHFRRGTTPLPEIRVREHSVFGLVPYVTTPFLEGDPRHVLRELLQGPARFPKDSKRAMRFRLEEKGVYSGIKVKLTKTPLRA